MDYAILKEEIVSDPLGRGYSGMTPQQIADSLNTINRTKSVQTVSGQDIFEAIVPTEFVALTADQKNLLYAIIGMDTIRVNGTNTRTALLSMFGVGTTTRANLAALQTVPVSRAVELGLGIVTEKDIILI